MFDINLLRENSSKIENLNDFENFYGENNVFIRIVGENNTFLQDFSRVERNLCREMSNGTVAYKRVSKLPVLTSTDDVNFYSECYNGWLRSYKKKMDIKSTKNNVQLSTALAEGISECLGKLKKTRSNMTSAMEKNFVVKLLFWFDSVSLSLVNKQGFNRCTKIIAENVVKMQEFLFFYLLAYVGFNVLLLENKCDIDSDAKKLELCVSSVIGHLGATELPPYVESNYNNSNSNTNTNSNHQQSGGIRVVIPPRPSKGTRVATSNTSGGGGIKVTIPPRPDRSNGSTARNVPIPPQQSSGVRMTIPPRQGRPSTSTPTQPQQGTNVRVTIPPRSSSPNTPWEISPNPTMPSQNDARGVRITTPVSQSIPMSIPRNRVPANSQPRVEKSYEELAQLASSIVQIYILEKKPFGKKEGEVVGTGSGIMIGENGYILTNCHVARAGTAYGVRLENEEEIYFTDELVKYHSDLDLAIIRIDRRLKPLKIYKGAQGLVRGQKVVAIGSPLGLFNTVSDGIISGFRSVDGVDMIQFTAPTSHGSSGGAVLNMYGEVIGISTAGIDDGQNINLAVGYEAINNFIGNFV